MNASRSAYLLIELRDEGPTIMPRVIGAGIFSEETPTQQLRGTIMARVLKMTAPTFSLARDAIIRECERVPELRWMLPLLWHRR